TRGPRIVSKAHKHQCQKRSRENAHPHTSMPPVYSASAPSLCRGRPPQYFLRGHVLHQLVAIHEIRRRGFALAEEFLRLIVPMAAFLMVALPKRYDRIRLRWVAHHNDLRRSLSAGPDHFFSNRPEADRARRGHSDVVGSAVQSPAANWKCSIAVFSADAKVSPVRNANRSEVRLEPLACF